MIKSFRDKDTEAIFNGEPVLKFQSIARVARRKLRSIHQARSLRDLSLPGNRLEAKRTAQHQDQRPVPGLFCVEQGRCPRGRDCRLPLSPETEESNNGKEEEAPAGPSRRGAARRLLDSGGRDSECAGGGAAGAGEPDVRDRELRARDYARDRSASRPLSGNKRGILARSAERLRSGKGPGGVRGAHRARGSATRACCVTRRARARTESLGFAGTALRVRCPTTRGRSIHSARRVRPLPAKKRFNDRGPSPGGCARRNSVSPSSRSRAPARSPIASSK